MQKVITATLTGALSFMLLSGCNNSPQPDNPSLSQNALYTNVKDSSKLKTIVIKAAKEKGWRVTEFKSDALIIEKLNGDNAKSATLKIAHGSVDFEDLDNPDDDDIVDLKEYIEDLAKQEQHH